MKVKILTVKIRENAFLSNFQQQVFWKKYEIRENEFVNWILEMLHFFSELVLFFSSLLLGLALISRILFTVFLNLARKYSSFICHFNNIFLAWNLLKKLQFISNTLLKLRNNYLKINENNWSIAINY